MNVESFAQQVWERVSEKNDFTEFAFLGVDSIHDILLDVMEVVSEYEYVYIYDVSDEETSAFLMLVDLDNGVTLCEGPEEVDTDQYPHGVQGAEAVVKELVRLRHRIVDRHAFLYAQVRT